MTYKKGSTGLQLETANFGSGVIRMTGSNSAQCEVNYFLTDHLGSVRVIVDGTGAVKERNDYYPFGARQARADYPQRDGNRLKYNGKEEQVTGDLKYLDYGARMYDSGLGRWFGMDPMAEDYRHLSPYNHVSNNPSNMVDPNGTYMDWFMNELTGNVYYNSDFRKGDENKIGNGWSWMGPNGMFDPDNPDPIWADFQALSSSGIKGYGNSVAINYDERGNMKLFSEALFTGDNARKFMQKQGFSLRPKEYIYNHDVTEEYHPDGGGTTFISVVIPVKDNSRIEKIFSYQYVHFSSELVESRILKNIGSVSRERSKYTWFCPSFLLRETSRSRRMDTYGNRRDNNWIWQLMDIIPWKDRYQDFWQKRFK